MAKRKMPIMPHKAKGADEVGRIYKKAMEKAKARQQADSRELKASGVAK
jgi:hypothetical protein